MGSYRVRTPEAGQATHEQLNAALGSMGQASTGQLNWLVPMLNRQELQMAKRFAPQYAALQRSMMMEDPLRAGLYQQGQSALGQIPTGIGELPPQMEAEIRNQARQEAVSRGIDIGSPASALEEWTKVMGGKFNLSEYLRSSRLQTASSMLGLTPQVNMPQMTMPSGLLPSTTSLMSAGLGGMQLQAGINAQNVGLQASRDAAIGQGLAMLGGAAVGGGAYAGSGGSFGAGFAGGLLGMNPSSFTY